MTHSPTASPVRARGLVALLLLILTAFVLQPRDATAATLALQSRESAGALPQIQPNWPVPRDGGQVFYIQRSPNKNTVVYAARMENGAIDPNRPIQAYWRRFNDAGEAKALNGIERRLAYGVNARANGDGTYRVTFKALPSKSMTLRMDGGRPALFLQMGEAEAQLVYAYLEVDEGGLIPSVTDLKLIGRLPSGSYVMETYRVKGGEL